MLLKCDPISGYFTYLKVTQIDVNPTTLFICLHLPMYTFKSVILFVDHLDRRRMYAVGGGGGRYVGRYAV